MPAIVKYEMESNATTIIPESELASFSEDNTVISYEPYEISDDDIPDGSDEFIESEEDVDEED